MSTERNPELHSPEPQYDGIEVDSFATIDDGRYSAGDTTLGRRDVLKAAGAAGITWLLAACSPPNNGIDESFTYQEEDAEFYRQHRETQRNRQTSETLAQVERDQTANARLSETVFGDGAQQWSNSLAGRALRQLRASDGDEFDAGQDWNWQNDQTDDGQLQLSANFTTTSDGGELRVMKTARVKGREIELGATIKLTGLAASVIPDANTSAAQWAAWLSRQQDHMRLTQADYLIYQLRDGRRDYDSRPQEAAATFDFDTDGNVTYADFSGVGFGDDRGSVFTNTYQQAWSRLRNAYR